MPPQARGCYECNLWSSELRRGQAKLLILFFVLQVARTQTATTGIGLPGNIVFSAFSSVCSSAITGNGDMEFPQQTHPPLSSILTSRPLYSWVITPPEQLFPAHVSLGERARGQISGGSPPCRHRQSTRPSTEAHLPTRWVGVFTGERAAHHCQQRRHASAHVFMLTLA